MKRSKAIATKAAFIIIALPIILLCSASPGLGNAQPTIMTCPSLGCLTKFYLHLFKTLPVSYGMDQYSMLILMAQPFRGSYTPMTSIMGQRSQLQWGAASFTSPGLTMACAGYTPAAYGNFYYTAACAGAIFQTMACAGQRTTTGVICGSGIMDNNTSLTCLSSCGLCRLRSFTEAEGEIPTPPDAPPPF